MGKVPRPFNFISLRIFLEAIGDDSVENRKHRFSKYGLNDYQWRQWARFSRLHGLAVPKSMGKGRGTRLVLTEKGKEILERIKSFMANCYSVLLDEVW